MTRIRHDAGTPICPLCRCEGPLGHRKQMVLILGSHSTVLGPARGTPGSSGKSSPTSQHLTQKYHYSYFSMPQVLLLQSSPLYSKWEDVRLRAISFHSVLHSSSPEFGDEIHSSLLHAEHCRRDGFSLPRHVWVEKQVLGSAVWNKEEEELSCTPHFLSSRRLNPSRHMMEECLDFYRNTTWKLM